MQKHLKSNNSMQNTRQKTKTEQDELQNRKI